MKKIKEHRKEIEQNFHHGTKEEYIDENIDDNFMEVSNEEECPYDYFQGILCKRCGEEMPNPSFLDKDGFCFECAGIRAQEYLSYVEDSAPPEEYEEIKIGLEEDMSYNIPKDILKKYLTVFNEVSINNQVAGELSFLHIMGAYFNKSMIIDRARENDLRSHVLWVQSSRTGKSESWRIISNSAKLLKISTNSIDDFTDAGLVGSRDANGKEVPGVLKEKKGILHWDEADNLFSGTKEYQSNTIRILQSVMDTFGTEGNRYEKSMKGGSIVLKELPQTLWLTTIEPSKIDQARFTKGFFQRVLCWVRLRTIDEEMDSDMEVFESRRGNKPQYDIVGKLKKVFENLPIRDERILHSSDEAIDAIKVKYLEWMDWIKEEAPSGIVSTARSFCLGYTDNLLTAAGVNCILRGKTEICKRDVDEWSDLITEVLRNFVIWIGKKWDTSIEYQRDKMKGVQFEKILKSVLGEMIPSENDEYNRKELYENIAKNSSYSPLTANQYLSEYIGTLLEKTSRGNLRLKLRGGDIK